MTSLLLSARGHADVSPTKLSLPKGPGSIEGLASADFQPSLASGAASYGIPIAVPPSARSFGPELSLSYDSAAGTSELGLGWRLTGALRIRRRTIDGLPHFTSDDPLEVVGLGAASELVEVSPGVFRPEHEDGAFLRVERSGDEWTVRSKSGHLFVLGGAAVESENGRVASYLLREAYDRRGHRVSYQWDTQSGYALLLRVVWNDFDDASRNEVLFEYEERPDPSRLFSSGIRQQLDRRMAAIEVLHGGELVRRYELGYSEHAHPRLATVTLLGSDGKTALPAATFTYSGALAGLDGDSQSAELVTMQSPPGHSPAEPNAVLSDLNGDGLPDLLLGTAGAYRSYLNLDGVSWAAGVDWASEESPTLSVSHAGVQMADVDGDGGADLLVESGRGNFRYFPKPREAAFSPPVPLSGALNLSFEDANVRLADMDGDRRVDFLATTDSGLAIGYNLDGKAFAPPVLVANLDGAGGPRLAEPDTHLCELNGDRVQDLCVLRSGSLVYYLGRGRGAFESAEEGRGVPAFHDSERYRLVDLNGDGWDDLVQLGTAVVFYALAVGEGRFGAVESMDGIPVTGPNGHVEFADVNASGSTDILWVDVSGSGAGSWQYLELFPQGPAGLLTELTNGLGKSQRIDYAPAAAFAAQARASGSPWTSRINVAMPVVSRISVDAGLGDPLLVTEFSYKDGTYAPMERTFAAFGSATTTALGDDSTPSLVTEHHFEAGLSHRALRGVTTFEEQRTLAGAVFSRSTFGFRYLSLDLGQDGRSVQYGYRSSVLTEFVEGDDSGSLRTYSECEQDAWGNPVVEYNWGLVDGDNYLAGGDEDIILRTFAANPETWTLGYLATEEVQDAAGVRVQASRKFYDGEPFEGLDLGQVGRGEVSREEAWLGPADDSYELTLATRYDEHGLPVETLNERGGGRWFEWGTDHTSLLAETVKLDSGVELVERARVDGRFGTITEAVDYSGARTRYKYDMFGRLTKVIAPGDTSELPTILYDYRAGAPLSRILTEARVASGKRTVERSEALFDGLGRKRMNLTEDHDKWLMAGLGLLDARGQVRRALRPRWAEAGDYDEPPLLADGVGSDSWRDGLAREVRTRSAEGVITRTEYAPLTVRAWDGGQATSETSFEHTPTVTVTDGQGRLVRHERTLNGASLAATYSYDAVGNLVARTDPEGNMQRFAYDGRGRRTEVDDPDQGVHTLSYDGSGNLLRHSYPDGADTTYRFDLADRLQSEDWNGDGAPEVIYTYDEGTTRALGKLVRVQEPSGLVEHQYDERGRVTETLYQIEGQDYHVGSRFDAQDREVEHIYPDGSRVEIHRNGRGQLAGYGEAIGIQYGADGVETVRKFSSGAQARGEHDQDGRRRELDFLAADGSHLEHLRWDYDPAGNLSAVTDLRVDVSEEGERSESFRYDNLYRLVGVTGTSGRTDWEYSPSGNLVSRTSTVAEQNAPQVTYGERPHTPTKLGGRSVSYDERGRMKADGSRTYEWDGANQLRRVQAKGGSVESTYGQDGVRRIKKERGASGRMSTTHLIDGWSEVKDGDLVRYIVHGSERIVRLGKERQEAPVLGALPPPHSLHDGTDGPLSRALFCALMALAAGLFGVLQVRAGARSDSLG